MIDKLNELLKGRFEVLYIAKWKHDNFINKTGYFNMILRSDDATSSACEVTIQDFEVVSINGCIFVSDIENINDALSELRKTEAVA